MRHARRPKRRDAGAALLLFLLINGGCKTPAQEARFAGVVASASPEATHAGVEILNRGGNAADAAVAVSFALGVTEPAMSGLGGQSQFILYLPGEGPLVVNGSSRAPAGIPAQVKRQEITGHRATTIPATVKSLHFVWRNYGSGHISWQEVLAPAIRYAEEGFVLGPFRHKVLQRHAAALQTSPSARALFLNPDGSIPAPGAVWQQPVLARTLRRLASHGAADFYHGEIARKIAANMAANAGWITAEDLAAFPEPVVMPPITTTYRGYEVCTLPPPGGGWVVLQILNLLEQFPPEQLRAGTEDRAVHLLHALQIAHKMRRLHPVQNLSDFSRDVQGKISKETAKELLGNSGGETTHFSVVDAGGMVVGVTASINAYYGSRVASPELGFLYNSYMHEFEFEAPDHPFALRPNALPYSSMSPAIVLHGGEPVLVLGSPGSSRIISTVAQIVQMWIDDRMPIDAAVAAPRLHVVPENAAYIEDYTESREWGADLRAMGFELKEPAKDLAGSAGNPYFGGVHAIARNGRLWQGVADPRRDGLVEYAKSSH